MFKLDGKVAIVTGGASGIGKATATRLAAAGAKVIIADLGDGQVLAEEIDGDYKRVDVGKENQIAGAMDDAIKRYGRLDIVINNAGIEGDFAFIEDATPEQYLECFHINTLGVAYGIKHGARLMVEGGAIVNTASLAGVRGSAGIGVYGVSKFGVVCLTKTAAIELAPKGIRVNCVCPGPVQTPMLSVEGGKEEAAMFEILTPAGRVCRPEEVAATIHFLCADDCQYITGQEIHLCGGATAGTGMQFFDNALAFSDMMK